MAEYIEREALISGLKALPEQERLECMGLYVLVRSMPAVSVEQLKWERDTAIEQLQSYGVGLGEKTDIVKVNHGEWELLNIGPDWADAKCSQCGAEHGFSPYKDFYKFCPDCGAKMDKEEQNHDSK